MFVIRSISRSLVVVGRCLNIDAVLDRRLQLTVVIYLSLSLYIYLPLDIYDCVSRRSSNKNIPSCRETFTLYPDEQCCSWDGTKKWAPDRHCRRSNVAKLEQDISSALPRGVLERPSHCTRWTMLPLRWNQKIAPNRHYRHSNVAKLEPNVYRTPARCPKWEVDAVSEFPNGEEEVSELLCRSRSIIMPPFCVVSFCSGVSE